MEKKILGKLYLVEAKGITFEEEKLNTDKQILQ
jgi:hypothetical protein